MADAKYWMGGSPEPRGDAKCDSCNTILETTFIDGKLASGPAAILCLSCHAFDGIGLGQGKGQKYQRQADKRWLKVAG